MKIDMQFNHSQHYSKFKFDGMTVYSEEDPCMNSKEYFHIDNKGK